MKSTNYSEKLKAALSVTATFAAYGVVSWLFDLSHSQVELHAYSNRGIASASQVVTSKNSKASPKITRRKKNSIKPDWNRLNHITKDINGTYLGNSGTNWCEKMDSNSRIYGEFFDAKSLGNKGIELNRITDENQMRHNHGIATRQDDLSYFEKSKKMSQEISMDAAERKAKIEGKEIQEEIERDGRNGLITSASAVALAASLYKGKNVRLRLGDQARIRSHVSVKKKYGDILLENPVVEMGMQYAQGSEDPVKFTAQRKVPIVGATASFSYGQKTQTKLASLNQPLVGGLSLGLETESRESGIVNNAATSSILQNSNQAGPSTDNRLRLQYGLTF